MTLEVDISNDPDENYWNENLEKSTSSTIYQVPNYSNVYKQVFDSKPVFVMVKKITKWPGSLLCLFTVNIIGKMPMYFQKH